MMALILNFKKSKKINKIKNATYVGVFIKEEE